MLFFRSVRLGGLLRSMFFEVYTKILFSALLTICLNDSEPEWWPTESIIMQSSPLKISIGTKKPFSPFLVISSSLFSAITLSFISQNYEEITDFLSGLDGKRLPAALQRGRGWVTLQQKFPRTLISRSIKRRHLDCCTLDVGIRNRNFVLPLPLAKRRLGSRSQAPI